MAYKVRFDNGKVVRFDSKPSSQDIEEVSQQFGGTQPQPARDLTSVLSSSKPIPETGDPVITRLLNLQKEFVGPVAQGVNTAAFGLPKFLANKLGGQQFAQETFPEQSTTGGKFRRAGAEGLGLFQGGAAQLARTGGAKLAPSLLSKVGLNLQKGTMAARRSAVLANKITRNAIEGAIFGGTQILGDEATLGGQVGQAVGGGLFGAAIPAIGSRFGVKKAGKKIITTGKIARGIKKFRTPTRTASIEGLTGKARKEAAGKLLSLKEETAMRINELDDVISKTNRIKKETFFDNRVKFTKNLRETRNQLNANLQALDDALNANTEEAALRIQEKLPEMYKANSKAFGLKLDDISEKLAKRGENITFSEIDDMLNKVIKDMDDAFITEGSPRRYIDNLKNRYEVIDTLDETTGQIFSNRGQEVPLQQFFDDIKNIRNSLTAGAQSGATRFTQEEVAVSMFNNQLGGLLETRVPDLVDLRLSYKPIIDAMKESNKIFKPFGGEFSKTRGATLLKKFSLQKTAQGENLLIQSIEQGSTFAPGIGNITDDLIRQGNEFKLAKSRITPIIQEMTNTNVLFRQGMDRKFYEQTQKLITNKRFINSNSVIKEQMITAQVEKRLAELGVRKNLVANLTKDKAKMMQFIRAFFFAAGGAAATAGAIGAIRYAR